MTDVTLTGASSAKQLDWAAINWKIIECNVKRLQMRIAKATREGRPGQVKALQWLLTHSKSAKLLAVKRVTTNRGAKTPGTDRVVWRILNKNTKQRCSSNVKAIKHNRYEECISPSAMASSDP
ncbi:reverse transcriptase [Legionella busanensis]|uniref:Reverse transcriptase n=1 Tax=Legionella busanensis TaxID=190655 RepID=A0A378KAB3_9GAMM|nr:reverse transcriptase N-terminal domain-containing protein [Legionella busanensis]STX81656.1 reverse transcriptase [Legionella busanensis]